MQHDMWLAKKLVLKKDAVPTVYPANVNMTRPSPITNCTEKRDTQGEHFVFLFIVNMHLW